LSVPASCYECKQKHVFKAYRALCDVCADKRVDVVCNAEMLKELQFMSNLAEKKEKETILKQNPKAAEKTSEKAESEKEQNEDDASSDADEDEPKPEVEPRKSESEEETKTSP